MLTFTVPGRPQQRGSKTPFALRRRDGSLVTRANGSPVINTTDDNKKSKAWMDSVRTSAVEALPSDWELLRGPVVLSVAFYFARPQYHYGTGRNEGRVKSSAPRYHTKKPDLAKLVRALEDALTGVVWADDSQVYCYGHIVKLWTSGMERTEVRVLTQTEYAVGEF